MLLQIHSYVAYAVLILVLAALLNSIIGFSSNKPYSDKNKKIYLFTLIASHIQLLIGLVWFFTSPKIAALTEGGMGAVMKNSAARNAVVEHPITMLIAIALITIGFSKHKKKEDAKSKFKTIMVFYGIALLLILAKIPWKMWFAS
ncbi:hypothetical protein [Aureivirga sp. CE67]|uniref:hypothetical protein n=1 Tax=Aureivirga sp. CE67 TaxID=1788983 RepID=UPI0018CA1623|nr:hypothetical protein [Aureivirga sp. CE67]